MQQIAQQQEDERILQQILEESKQQVHDPT
jgi:hypothetical protein